MNKKKLLVAFNMNIAIIVLTIIAMGVAVIDVNKWEITYPSVLIYYTTLSNLFLFISAIISFIYELLIVLNKKKEIPNWVNVVKLCGVASTTITFLVVIIFLTPTMAVSTDPSSPGVAFLYSGSNLIFHVFNPIIAIVLFLLFEHTDKIKLPQVCFSMIFTAIYGIIYSLDIIYKFIPITGIQEHDWYDFMSIVNGNNSLIPLLVIAFIGIAFLVSWLLWLGNRKINIMNKKESATK